MAANRINLFVWLIGLMMFGSTAAYSQAHLPPVAINDSVSVTQPYFDTINVTANDYSPTGDRFCVTQVYGSSLFSLLNCNEIAFRSDSSAFGNDTVWYVVCNDSSPNLCDTGLLVVTVQRHYTPLMLNNSRWTTYAFIDGEAMDPGNSPEQYYWNYYWTGSDTLINSLGYKIIHQKFSSMYYFSNPVFWNGATETAGYLRQDTANRRVYFLPLDSVNELLLYDFNVNVEDTLNRTNIDTAFVTSFDYFKSNENYYRRTNFENRNLYLGWYNEPSSWIEGIGSDQGILNPYSQAFGAQLICFSTNGQTLYPNYSIDTCVYTPAGIENALTTKTSIYPNPATGVCTLKLSISKESISANIYDIAGRLVLPLFVNQRGDIFNFNVTSLTDGLYFVRITDQFGNTGIAKLIKE